MRTKKKRKRRIKKTFSVFANGGGKNIIGAKM